MNPPKSAESEVRALLREAHPLPSLPPRFQEGVWRRLERVQCPAVDTRMGWLELFVRGVLRPSYATVGLTAVMLAGAWFGVRDGTLQAHRLERVRYAVAVSPLHQTAP